VLGSNDKSTAAYNCSGRPTPLERISAKYPSLFDAGERHFLASGIKKASDIAVLDPGASSY
jgi:hypothetical protein